MRKGKIWQINIYYLSNKPVQKMDSMLLKFLYKWKRLLKNGGEDLTQLQMESTDQST